MSLQKSVQFCAICVQFDAFYVPKFLLAPIYVHSKKFVTPYVLGARKALNFESVGCAFATRRGRRNTLNVVETKLINTIYTEERVC